MTPNTQITQENVGDVPEGGWLMHDKYGLCRFFAECGGVGKGWIIVTCADEKDAACRLSNLTYIGPDLGDGWIGHSGGENPVPGMRVDVRTGLGFETEIDSVRVPDWRRVIAFRPALSKPNAPGREG